MNIKYELVVDVVIHNVIEVTYYNFIRQKPHGKCNCLFIFKNSKKNSQDKSTYYCIYRIHFFFCDSTNTLRGTKNRFIFSMMVFTITAPVRKN